MHDTCIIDTPQHCHRGVVSGFTDGIYQHIKNVLYRLDVDQSCSHDQWYCDIFLSQNVLLSGLVLR